MHVACDRVVETAHRVTMSPAGGAFRKASATIVDESGRTLGQLATNSWFAARVPPGQHLFAAIEGPTRPVQAWLAPHRVYVVEVKLASVRGMALEPLTPRHGHWDRVPQWLGQFKQYPAAFDAPPTLAGIDAIARARAHLASLSPDAAERTILRPDDGTDAPISSKR